MTNHSIKNLQSRAAKKAQILREKLGISMQNKYPVRITNINQPKRIFTCIEGEMYVEEIDKSGYYSFHPYNYD